MYLVHVVTFYDIKGGPWHRTRGLEVWSVELLGVEMRRRKRGF
jgi:hypothetical protein